MNIQTYTWQRDSHGLFDYEQEPISNHYAAMNSGITDSIANLYRENNEVKIAEGRSEREIGEKLEKVEASAQICHILKKQQRFWIYHKPKFSQTDM